MRQRSVTYPSMFILTLNGLPIARGDDWRLVANHAVEIGLAKWVWGCLFTLVPGAKIQ